MLNCPKCGYELINPFVDDRQTGDVISCERGCRLSDERSDLNEKALCEAISEIDRDAGYNLFHIYLNLKNTDIHYINASGSCYNLTQLENNIRSLSLFLIVGDIKTADSIIRKIPETNNNLRKKITTAKDRDMKWFYQNSDPQAPWDKFITQEDMRSAYPDEQRQDGDDKSYLESNPDVFFGKLDGYDTSSKETTEIMKKEFNYRGSDIKIIGVIHNSRHMLQDIKEEILGCQLVLVEAASGNSFNPHRCVGHQAADEYRNYVGFDGVVRIVEGDADVENWFINKIITEVESQDPKIRKSQLDDVAEDHPDRFKNWISERNAKFSKNAICHIEDYGQKYSYPSKVALIIGKDHFPGTVEFFGGLDWS